jgi:hypothetical protein
MGGPSNFSRPKNALYNSRSLTGMPDQSGPMRGATPRVIARGFGLAAPRKTLKASGLSYLRSAVLDEPVPARLRHWLFRVKQLTAALKTPKYSE